MSFEVVKVSNPAYLGYSNDMKIILRILLKI